MYSKPTNFQANPVNGRYSIYKLLKAGGFGSVYIAKDLKDPTKQYAIKLSSGNALGYAQIENKLYNLIEKKQFTNGFIKFYQTGEYLKNRYILMELVGQDLDELKKRTKNGSFSIKSVLMIGLQVIDRLQALHKIGYLHRDVKPDNLAIGLAEKNKIIYLFDFGLALPIGSQMPKEDKGKVIGTIGFMSCRAHQGKLQGPVDDIESMIYTLLYLAEGTLPWLQIQLRGPADFHKVLLKKRSLNKKSFKNQQIPQQIFDLLQMVQAGKPSQKVDYLKLKYKLLEALKRINQRNDFIFDWCGNTSRRDLSSPKKKKQSLSPSEKKLTFKQLEKMNEENQNMVQNDIYEVYKFLEKEKPKEKNDKQKQPAKKQVPKPKVPSPKKNEPRENNAQRKRPMSGMPKARPQQKHENPWDKIIFFQQSNTHSGPQIVINKTAKHKI